MQFTKDGPDVPERLLQAHEDGRVVFFCGAGISYPAGLPGFKGLVERLYTARNVVPDPVQAAAIRSGRYDTAIGLLEARDIGGRATVREALVDILTPNLTAPRATDTHQALLTLGTTRDGHTRLVTTNFDRIFETVLSRTDDAVNRYRAPLLPIPKSRWDGLVYLHGLLTENPSPSDLTRVVVSSGDFGLAYLTERWASRFVSELFRNYTVCFVGYSLDDPVLRYMTDALSADHLLGEPTREMFAFAVYSRGKELVRDKEWKAKNVTPILYKAHRRHAHLHRTLRDWSATYRDGARGKERIVVEYARANPRTSLKPDDFVSRMLWALSDPSGLPAKRFANLDPVPSLDWLDPLSDSRFGHRDLARFSVPPQSAINGELAFSLTCRPSPYTLAPWMTFADGGPQPARWDAPMSHLADWLTRHLDDPSLLLRLSALGGHLHSDLARKIDHSIRHLTTLERDGRTVELDRIRANAPNAIPSAPMRTLWRLFLSGCVRTRDSEHGLIFWKDRFDRDGLTATLRLELRALLTPRVSLSELVRLPSEVDDGGQEQSVRDLVEWEVVLSTEMVRSRLRDLASDSRWLVLLPDLLQDFSGLLRDALDLMHELGGANEKMDLSHIHQPSISDHSQNRGFRDWTVLIELARDSWIATSKNSPSRAKFFAEDWWQTPYPVFRRLAMYAATQDTVIPPYQALNWLLEDEGWWLWSTATSRESIRLLVFLAPQLDRDPLRELERAILAGPPRQMFRSDIEPELWNQIRDRDIWLRLSKMVASGVSLGTDAQAHLVALERQNPDWRIAPDERDEFSTWLSTSNDSREFVATPREPSELAAFLQANQWPDPWHEDDWANRCESDFDVAAAALSALAENDSWPANRWGQALRVWSRPALSRRAWERIAAVVVTAPPEQLLRLSHDISSWLRQIAADFEGQESIFFLLCDNLLALAYESPDDTDDTKDPVGRAINHPVGNVAWALLAYWYRGSLEDGQRLPTELSNRFSDLCDTQVAKFRHARVLLAAHLVNLFRVDQEWTVQFLLPLFEWSSTNSEARGAWTGFLWSPRLYRPLVEEFKQGFLDTATHYAKLGEFKSQYSSLLTFAALDPSDVFTKLELAEATRTLPQDGLEEAAEALAHAIEGAGDQRVPYWKNRVKPYLRAIWPKTRDTASPSVAESFGRVCIAAGEAFPEAMRVVRPYLQRVRYSDRLVQSVREARLDVRFPHEALELLDRVVDEENAWPSRELVDCLRTIRTAAPAVAEEHRFVRLLEYLHRSGTDL